MDKNSLLERLQDVVHTLRDQLNQNETSVVDSVVNAAKVGYETLKAGLSGKDGVKFALEKFKEHIESFEKALKTGDRETATRTLEAMESTIANLKTMDI